MLNFFDLFVIVISIGLAISGFREGLIRSIVKLVGFVITLMILTIFSQTIKDLISGFSHGFAEKILVIVVFISSFVILSFLFHILAVFLNGIIKFTPIDFINSGLGCLLGLLKAALLCGIVAVFLSFAPKGSFFYNQFNTSHSAGGFRNLAYGVIPFLKNTIKTLNNENHLKQKENNDGQYKNRDAI